MYSTHGLDKISWSESPPVELPELHITTRTNLLFPFFYRPNLPPTPASVKSVPKDRDLSPVTSLFQGPSFTSLLFVRLVPGPLLYVALYLFSIRRSQFVWFWIVY